MAQQRKPKLSKHAAKLFKECFAAAHEKQWERWRAAMAELQSFVAQLEYNFDHYEDQPEPLEDE